MTNKIEQVIDEIEAYIDGCKSVPFSNNSIIVDKEQIMELIRELRTKTPDEIKRYQKIVSNKEAILNDARGKAQQLLEDAKAQTNELISEHEIMRQAYDQASEIVSSAATKAQQIIDGAGNEANSLKAQAVSYTDQLLAEVQNVLQNSINTTNAHYEQLLTDFTSFEEMVRSNRAELVPPQPVAAPETYPMQDGQTYLDQSTAFDQTYDAASPAAADNAGEMAAIAGAAEPTV
ncbi:hypothetical protein [Butyrivibrio sp. MC2013]|uniref:hypothetical protein n=1 Tax=Butyrivibrio sp. MC2013 TaxID=1280686 RepID=UPI000422570A|nr:hypothetical protein [Butyrivibrio sp. MC2013]